MSFDTDPGEQAPISAANFAQMCDEMKALRESNETSTAALKQVETYLVERGVEFSGTTGRTIVLPAIRAAIAKATGKDPS